VRCYQSSCLGSRHTNCTAPILVFLLVVECRAGCWCLCCRACGHQKQSRQLSGRQLPLHLLFSSSCWAEPCRPNSKSRLPKYTTIHHISLQCWLCRFNDAIRSGRIHHIEAIDNCCILAAVGQQMASRKGVSATMFSALAKSNINIRCSTLTCCDGLLSCGRPLPMRMAGSCVM